RVGKRLVRTAGYQLVPLPFTEAFSMISVDQETHHTDRIKRLHLQSTVIPTYTYAVSPAVPPEPCRTVGTRLLLVAHERVPADAVSRLLAVLYEGPSRNLLALPELSAMPHEYPLHAGSESYRSKMQPMVRSDVIDLAQKVISLLGAVLGGAMGIYGFVRWRRVLKFESFFQQILHIKSIVKGEFSDPEFAAADNPRDYLLQKLDELQDHAVRQFSQGRLHGDAILVTLLALISDTREWLKNRPVQ
ncbi:MAG: hypothetical protein N2C14_19885, partial [Planctomycetales bacterium]